MRSVKFQEYTQLLRQAGSKATPGRLALLELLDKTQKPLSIKDIQKNLQHTELDQATIYRVVNVLEKKGVIQQVDFKHGHGHYELATSGHHHHIICERCGKIKDVICDTTYLEKQVLKSSGFAKISQHSLEFFGVCDSCAKK